MKIKNMDWLIEAKNAFKTLENQLKDHFSESKDNDLTENMQTNSGISPNTSMEKRQQIRSKSSMNSIPPFKKGSPSPNTTISISQGNSMINEWNSIMSVSSQMILFEFKKYVKSLVSEYSSLLEVFRLHDDTNKKSTWNIHDVSRILSTIYPQDDDSNNDNNNDNRGNNNTTKSTSSNDWNSISEYILNKIRMDGINQGELLEITFNELYIFLYDSTYLEDIQKPFQRYLATQYQTYGDRFKSYLLSVIHKHTIKRQSHRFIGPSSVSMISSTWDENNENHGFEISQSINEFKNVWTLQSDWISSDKFDAILSSILSFTNLDNHDNDIDRNLWYTSGSNSSDMNPSRSSLEIENKNMIRRLRRRFDVDGDGWCSMSLLLKVIQDSSLWRSTEKKLLQDYQQKQSSTLYMPTNTLLSHEPSEPTFCDGKNICNSNSSNGNNKPSISNSINSNIEQTQYINQEDNIRRESIYSSNQNKKPNLAIIATSSSSSSHDSMVTDNIIGNINNPIISNELNKIHSPKVSYNIDSKVLHNLSPKVNSENSSIISPKNLTKISPRVGTSSLNKIPSIRESPSNRYKLLRQESERKALERTQSILDDILHLSHGLRSDIDQSFDDYSIISTNIITDKQMMKNNENNENDKINDENISTTTTVVALGHASDSQDRNISIKNTNTLIEEIYDLSTKLNFIQDSAIDFENRNDDFVKVETNMDVLSVIQPKLESDSIKDQSQDGSCNKYNDNDNENDSNDNDSTQTNRPAPKLRPHRKQQQYQQQITIPIQEPNQVSRQSSNNTVSSSFINDWMKMSSTPSPDWIDESMRGLGRGLGKALSAYNKESMGSIPHSQSSQNSTLIHSNVSNSGNHSLPKTKSYGINAENNNSNNNSSSNVNSSNSNNNGQNISTSKRELSRQSSRNSIKSSRRPSLKDVPEYSHTLTRPINNMNNSLNTTMPNNWSMDDLYVISSGGSSSFGSNGLKNLSNVPNSVPNSIPNTLPNSQLNSESDSGINSGTNSGSNTTRENISIYNLNRISGINGNGNGNSMIGSPHSIAESTVGTSMRISRNDSSKILPSLKSFPSRGNIHVFTNKDLSSSNIGVGISTSTMNTSYHELDSNGHGNSNSHTYNSSHRIFPQKMSASMRQQSYNVSGTFINDWYKMSSTPAVMPVDESFRGLGQGLGLALSAHTEEITNPTYILMNSNLNTCPENREYEGDDKLLDDDKEDVNEEIVEEYIDSSRIDMKDFKRFSNQNHHHNVQNKYEMSNNISSIERDMNKINQTNNPSNRIIINQSSEVNYPISSIAEYDISNNMIDESTDNLNISKTSDLTSIDDFRNISSLFSPNPSSELNPAPASDHLHSYSHQNMLSLSPDITETIVISPNNKSNKSSAEKKPSRILSFKEEPTMIHIVTPSLNHDNDNDNDNSNSNVDYNDEDTNTDDKDSLIISRTGSESIMNQIESTYEPKSISIRLKTENIDNDRYSDNTIRSESMNKSAQDLFRLSSRDANMFGSELVTSRIDDHLGINSKVVAPLETTKEVQKSMFDCDNALIEDKSVNNDKKIIMNNINSSNGPELKVLTTEELTEMSELPPLSPIMPLSANHRHMSINKSISRMNDWIKISSSPPPSLDDDDPVVTTESLSPSKGTESSISKINQKKSISPPKVSLVKIEEIKPLEESLSEVPSTKNSSRDESFSSTPTIPSDRIKPPLPVISIISPLGSPNSNLTSLSSSIPVTKRDITKVDIRSLMRGSVKGFLNTMESFRVPSSSDLFGGDDVIPDWMVNDVGSTTTPGERSIDSIAE